MLFGNAVSGKVPRIFHNTSGTAGYAIFFIR